MLSSVPPPVLMSVTVTTGTIKCRFVYRLWSRFGVCVLRCCDGSLHLNLCSHVWFT